MRQGAGDRQTITIGTYRIVPDQHRIIGPAGPVRVEPKVMQVLLCLVDGNGSTVSRDALIDRVWGASGATDDLVSRAISELRRALGDDPKRPQVIETIRKRGYRLVVPPEPAQDAENEPGRKTRRRRRHPLVTAPAAAAALAVLAASVAALFRGNEVAGSAGLSAHPLVSLAGPEIQPSFSPDGKTIAFAHRAAGQRWRSIILLAADGSGAVRPAPRQEADLAAPAWSPDGKTLAAIATAPSGCSLVMWHRPDAAFRSIGPCPASEATFLTWLGPDSLVVSARTARAAPKRLYVVSTHDGGTRALTAPAGRSLGDDGPITAPDGDAVAFIRRRTEGVGDVWIVTRTGQARRLTRDDRTIFGVAWDADGRGIVFASNRDGRDGIWHVDRRGGSATWLMGTEGPAWDLTVAPDGRRFVFERRSLVADIWRVSLRDPGRSLVRTVGSTAWDAKPRVDPTGAGLLFESNRDGTYELWTATATGDSAIRLTSLGAPYDGSGAWSHDGRRVAFNGRRDGTGDIWVVDRSSGAAKRFTGPTSDDAVPSWSRHDQWIYFASDRSGRWEVWKIPSDSGPAQQVTHGGGYRALEAADGRTLYFTRLDSAGIWRLRPGGGRSERVVADLAVGDFDNWTLRNDTLLYLARGTTPGRVTLRMVSPSNGTSASLAAIDSVPREAGGIDVSPDGASLYVTRITRNESDLLEVELLAVRGRPLADRRVQR